MAGIVNVRSKEQLKSIPSGPTLARILLQRVSKASSVSLPLGLASAEMVVTRFQENCNLLIVG